MAKILVCADGFFRAFSAFGLEPYIEGFINTLVRNGNYVMPCIAKDFEIAGKFRRKYIKRKTNKEILAFNPDLIIAFNNAIDPECICNLTCPILVIASDTPVYWRSKDFIKNNSARYSVAYFNNDMADLLNTEYKIPLNRQILIPYSTDMHANKKIAAKYDISFIGNFYNPNPFLSDYLFRNLMDMSDENKAELKKLVTSIFDELEKKHEKTPNTLELYKKIISILGYDRGYDKFVAECFISLTQEKRQKLFDNLLDMDLHIWTWDANLKCICNNHKLFEKCHLDACYSQEQNEAVYNSSKISLNMPHGQANTGFSWRVCDILASNALLISNPSEDLTRLFGGIIPTYKNAKELREKIKYYLTHDKERREIVEKCHKIINKNHRYENVFEVIGNYYNFKLLGTGAGELTLPACTIYKQNKWLRNHKNKKVI